MDLELYVDARSYTHYFILFCVPARLALVLLFELAYLHVM